jgi:ribulose-5-phosphate 4-epimerase/fuculose-1-phosphate aldolase
MPEQGEYKGIKFSVVWPENRMPPEHAQIPRLIECCNEFNQLGLTPINEKGTYGNFSIRVCPENLDFIITAAGIKKGDVLDAGHFVRVSQVDLENEVVHVAGGIREPSSESMVHDAIYRRFCGVYAIAHGHCADILAFGQKLGIPETAEEKPYGTRGLVEQVNMLLDKPELAYIGQPLIFNMANHGFVAYGATIESVRSLVLEVLEGARRPQSCS